MTKEPKEETRMRIGTVDVNELRGFTDKVIGLSKEVVGTVIDSQRLQKEGESQQARASETLKALRAQVKAQGHEAKAGVFERQQRAAQRSKERAS
jgi:uncharacterized protein YjbJ (UPF0337 family)